MRFLVGVILMVSASAGYDFDCRVTCPTGYSGGCVKDDGGCYCSCSNDTNKLKTEMLRSLRNDIHASDTLQKEAASLLKNKDQLEQTTLTDPKTNKTVTLFLGKEK